MGGAINWKKGAYVQTSNNTKKHVGRDPLRLDWNPYPGARLVVEIIVKIKSGVGLPDPPAAGLMRLTDARNGSPCCQIVHHDACCCLLSSVFTWQPATARRLSFLGVFRPFHKNNANTKKIKKISKKGFTNAPHRYIIKTLPEREGRPTVGGVGMCPRSQARMSDHN